MQNTLSIAHITLKEIARHRIIYALLAIIGFMIGAGFLLSTLSLTQQARLMVNFSFVTSNLSLVLLSVYFSSVLISQEIKNKTLIILFSKPLARWHLIVGKYMGLAFVMFLVTLFFIVFVILVYKMLGQSINILLFSAMSGIFMEVMVLIALAFCFSTFCTSPLMVILNMVMLWLIGHSTNSISFLLKKLGDDSLLAKIIEGFVYVLPNLEKFNWRSNALYGDTLPMSEFLSTLTYSGFWTLFLLTATIMIFNKKTIG